MRALLLCSILVPWGAVGCGHDAPQSPDLLLISVDTLRPDFLSTYGHPRPTAESLDALAADGAVFLNHLSASSQTAPSHASLLTGLAVREHGLLKNGLSLSSEARYLPEVLREAGWQTVGSMALGLFGVSLGFERGFDSFVAAGPERVGTRGSTEHVRIAEDVVDSALEQLAGAEFARPLFQLVHVFDPHTPYTYPPRIAPLDIEAGAELMRARAEPSERFTLQERVELQLLYESEVQYTFQELGRLFEAWDREREAANSVIAVTADHGEGLGEHDYPLHDLFLYQEQIHVPLVLRAVGRIPAGRRIEAATSAIDLPATLLDLLGLGDARHGLPGKSLAPLWSDRPRSAGPLVAQRPFHTPKELQLNPERRETLAHFAGSPAAARGQLLSLVEWPWKLLWSSDGEAQLYRLDEDPGELEDRARDEPERVARLNAELQDWIATRRPTLVSEDLSQAPGMQALLDELGYGSGAESDGDDAPADSDSDL